MAPESTRPVKAVTFDVGGTLIEPWPSVGHIYAEVAERHGYPGLSAEALNQRFAAAWSKRDRFSHLREEWAALVDATFHGLVLRPPSQTFFPELYDRFTEAGAWRIYEDVLPTLEALARRGLKLGVISDWDERLHPLLAALKLRSYFSVVIVSCEVGATKPAPVIFESAAAALSAAPGEILHLGDDRVRDCEGARRAGFQARLIERNTDAGGATLAALCAEFTRKI